MVKNLVSKKAKPPQGRIKSLRTKILLAYLPIIALGVTIIFGVQEYRNFSQNHMNLVERLREASLLLRANLVKPVWSFDNDAINLILTATSQDPDFESAAVLNDAGEILAARGPHDRAPSDTRLRMSWPLTTEGLNRETKAIGQFTLSFSAQRLEQQLISRLMTNVLELVVLLALLGAITVFVTHRIIDPPLGRLLASIQILQKKGERRPVDWQASDELGEVIQAYNTMLEQQDKAETDLRNSRQELRLLLASTSEGIFTIDLDGVCTFCNPSWISLLGYDDPSELLGQRMRDILRDPATVETGSAGGMNLLFENSSIRETHSSDAEEFQRRDGSTLPVEYHSNPIMHDGELVGTVVSFTDISARLADREEHMRLERQLRHSQKMETIGTLAGGIAHDFNNILMPIVGYVDLMIPMTDDRPELKSHLERVAKGAQRAADLVRQILTFSRQLEGEDIREPILLQGPVNEALKLIRASVPPSVEIKNLVDQDCPRVRANSTQIHQMVINLCTNAAQAMPNGGSMEARLETVTIETTQRHGSDDLEPGEYVRLAVSDSGMGMDEATMDRIFEPFFTTKEVGQGTGLGLSMVHGIVQAHAGLVEVQSSPGEGCMFEIYLPVSTRVEKAETFELPTPEGGNERILFVDDEDMIVELMESMLPALGYKTTCFTNGHAALAALRAVPESFDLLITDLSMPQMNGDQLAEAVKAVAPDLPIIMMTGNNDDFSEAGIETLNVTSMLRKPLRQADLDAAIRRALGGERQRLNIAANQT